MTALRALLVEDSEDDALLVVRELSGYGLEIDPRRVATEEQLLEALADGPWDLAILDHKLPGFGGLEALELLQKHGFNGPMITVSGTIGEETAVEVMRSGAHDYVMKDNLTRLGPAIERELREAQVRQERREARRALRASEERYRTLVETVGDGLTMIDRDARITYANEAFAEMIERPIDELIGMQLQEMYAPVSQERLEQQLQERFEKGVSAEYEATLQSGSGEQIPVLTHATPLRDDDGRITGSLAVIKDITERKRAEEELRQSEERLRAVFEASPDGILAVDPDGRVTDCNPAVMRALAVESEEQIIGRSALDFVAEDSADQFQRDVRAVLDGKTARSLHYEMVSLDGRRFPVEASANAITDEDGTPVSIVATVKDITQRREAERKLQQLNQFRRSIIDQANIWIHVLDRQLKPILWNPAAAEISGIPEEEAVGDGTTWKTLYPDPATRREVFHTAREIIEDGRVLENHETTIHTREQGERIISWNARRLLDPEGEPIGLLAMGRDVTEHKQLEEQLRHAVKMEAIGRLAGGIAHDFNNMLTAILGNVQLLSMHMDAESDRQRLLEEIRVAARRSADLTRQLLAFSRRQAITLEALDLNTVVERIEQMLERMIGEHIAVLTNLDPD
ncbi:MAG: PAS domain-containing protein, partial [Armatimonadota bacterium]